ncbi:hypothetical protein EKL29_18995 [Pantoea sp. YU22]|jgi:hypothetical protein|nr:hypothetical protein D7S44_09090 [Pantoea piersonii]RTY55086.1 hypothetical protein EKL29_18995 [Pantoea sp. YU22]HCW99075.1 hypothetical protein [Pantoea sp.]
MWANTLSSKQSLSAPQLKAPACKGKESSVTEHKVTIPDSWELSENQRHFIESFMDPKAK